MGPRRGNFAVSSRGVLKGTIKCNPRRRPVAVMIYLILLLRRADSLLKPPQNFRLAWCAIIFAFDILSATRRIYWGFMLLPDPHPLSEILVPLSGKSRATFVPKEKMTVITSPKKVTRLFSS